MENSGRMISGARCINDRKASVTARGLGPAVLMALLVLLGSASHSRAEISVNIGINAPPPPVYVVPAPPPVVVIPGTYVYFAPGLDVDILFYHGSWYRPHGNYWYRAQSYNGPWRFIAPERVPHVLVSLPPDYRRAPPGRGHIPYGQLKKNWGRWERERHWDTHGDRYDEDRGPRRGEGPERRDWGHDEGGHGGGGR
jgi:hypothetical protein